MIEHAIDCDMDEDCSCSRKVEMSEADVKTIESLCDAAARAEGYQAALTGWALVLRLRDALGMKPETHVIGRG